MVWRRHPHDELFRSPKPSPTGKRIKNLHTQRPEIPLMTRRHRQPIYHRRRRDHRVLVHLITTSHHQLRPQTKSLAIHRKHIEMNRNFIQPRLNLPCFFGILNARPRNPRLQVSKCNSRQKQCSLIHSPQPRHHATMRLHPPQFGNHICIEQIHNLKFNRRPAARFAPRWNIEIEPPFIGKQQVFERRPVRHLQPFPFSQWHQHRLHHATFGNQLRPLRHAGLQHRTEFRLGILHRPNLHESLLTRHLTRPDDCHRPACAASIFLTPPKKPLVPKRTLEYIMSRYP